MSQYHKIQSVYKRDPETKFSTLLEGEYSEPEFELLKDCLWTFTEKVDGTNIRVYWNGVAVRFEGRTEKAKIPPFLLEALKQIFPEDQLKKVFPDCNEEKEIILYGEGYGNKIQKVGKKYLPNSQGFILFDVKVGHIWLTRTAVDLLAEQLNVPAVPIIGVGTLDVMVEMVRNGFKSKLGDMEAEGIVARPAIELRNRMGQRIITKIKAKDFKK